MGLGDEMRFLSAQGEQDYLHYDDSGKHAHRIDCGVGNGGRIVAQRIVGVVERHIACQCYGNPAVYKPRIETSDLCSSEHSKVCFE